LLVATAGGCDRLGVKRTPEKKQQKRNCYCSFWLFFLPRVTTSGSLDKAGTKNVVVLTTFGNTQGTLSHLKDQETAVLTSIKTPNEVKKVFVCCDFEKMWISQK
jgi:hypothetical protein